MNWIPKNSAKPAARATGGETILVVEDDPRVRRVSVRRLKELGYKVIEAEDGPSALKALDRPDLVDLLFTDVVMGGGMSGIDLAQEVRRQHPDLKILFTSGFADPAIQRKGLMEASTGLARQAVRNRRTR